MSSKPEIWLIGNKGMLGKQIEEELKKKNIAFFGTDKEVDIRNLSILKEFTKFKEINWIINCAAYTAVDKAEEEKLEAFELNVKALENLSDIAKWKKAKLIHFSTDYVFDGRGTKPYRESDAPNPQSVYGETKRAGERKITENFSEYFIIRISWLYGVYGKNFVKSMLDFFETKEEINVVSDQIGSPTFTGMLASNIVELVKKERNNYGIYHYSDKGWISWYGFAKEIQDMAFKRKLIKKKIKINKIPTEGFPTLAKRPKNSRMDKTKIAYLLHFKIINWKKNLEKFFNEWEKTIEINLKNKKKDLIKKGER